MSLGINNINDMKGRIKDYNKKRYANPFFKRNGNAPFGRGQDFYYGAKNRKIINFWKKIIIFFSFLILACLILSAAYLVFYYPYFSIKDIEISGLEKIGDAEIRGMAERQIAKKRFFVLKQENLFIFDKNEFEEEINSRYNLASLNVDKELPDILRIEVIEKHPVLIWKTGEKFYEVDEGGIAIREISANESNQGVPVVYDENNVEISIKMAALRDKTAEFIINFKKRIDDRFDVKITHFKALNDLLKAQTSEGWEIYMSSNDDFDQQTEKLFLFFKNKKIEVGNSLNYIDLRFEDRVYYK